MPMLFDLSNNFETGQEALDWANGFVFAECPTAERDYPANKRLVGVVQGNVKVWYDFGADYYFYEEVVTKTWLVKLAIFSGEYEKATYHLVQALDEMAAEKLALTNECHDEPEFDEKGCNDLGGEYYYRATWVKHVQPDDVEVLKRYFN